MGMGNAYTAVVDNEDAFFYNPASFSKFRTLRWTLVSGDLGVTLSPLKDMRKMLDLDKRDEFEKNFSSFYSRTLAGGIGGRMSFEIPYFMAMVSSDAKLHTNILRPTFPFLKLNAYNDFSLGLGFSYPLTTFIDTGFSFKQVTRIGVMESVGPEWIVTLDPEYIEDNLQKKGKAFVFDWGVNFSMEEIFLQPIFSFVWKNFTKSKFKPLSSSNEAPPGYESEMVAGMAVTFVNKILNITPSIEMKHIVDEDIHWTKKVHIGIEAKMPLLTFRSGFNQGYYTLGGGIHLFGGLIQVDAAYYHMELGRYAGQFREDRISLNAKLAISLKEGFFEGSKSSDGHFLNRFKNFWRRLKKRRF